MIALRLHFDVSHSCHNPPPPKRHNPDERVYTPNGYPMERVYTPNGYPMEPTNVTLYTNNRRMTALLC
jgi:hypothetical protein